MLLWYEVYTITAVDMRMAKKQNGNKKTVRRNNRNIEDYASTDRGMSSKEKVCNSEV